jgi:hypothetical protein
MGWVFNTMGFEEIQILRHLADSLGLAVTGGSDFHGSEEGLLMGRGRGNLLITSEILDTLYKKRPARL